MKEWVREKLKQVNDLYPTERLDKSKDRWRAMWNGEVRDRYPFVFTPATVQYYDGAYTPEEGLRVYLDEMITRGIVEDDFIPAFFPGCRQGTIPSMFGAKEIIIGQDYTNERILFANEDIDRLPEPSIMPDTPASFWLEMQRYYLHECEGEMPVHVCDMQGPMDVAGQLFGYDNLFLCAYDDEDRFRRLMHLAGDAFCLLWEKQRDLLGDHFIGTHLYGWDWVPQDNGASLSADSMAMLSGSFFAEYYTELLESICARLGRLTVHSCGDFSATVRPLGALDCVQAVNASQMPLEALLSAGWPTNKMIVLQEPIDRAETVFQLAREKKLRLDVSFGGMWPQKDGRVMRPAEWTDEQRAQMKARAARVAEMARAN